jgi:hypothetical protein
MRNNILGCFLVLATLSLVDGAAELLGHPDLFYRINGYSVIVTLVLLFVWPFLTWRMRAGGAGIEPGAIASGS